MTQLSFKCNNKRIYKDAFLIQITRKESYLQCSIQNVGKRGCFSHLTKQGYSMCLVFIYFFSPPLTLSSCFPFFPFFRESGRRKREVAELWEEVCPVPPWTQYHSSSGCRLGGWLLLSVSTISLLTPYIPYQWPYHCLIISLPQGGAGNAEQEELPGG